MKAFIAGRVFGSSAFGAVSRRSALLVLFIVPALVPPSSAQASQKNVLILSGRASINQMESSLRAYFSEPVNFSVVDLVNPRFEQKGYQDNLAEALRAGYASEKLELIVAVMIRALLRCNITIRYFQVCRLSLCSLSILFPARRPLAGLQAIAGRV
jgi:hypothetical protein